MDYTTWTEMQQNPNSTTDPHAQNYYYSHLQNPNPNPNVDPQNPHGSLVQPSVPDPFQPVGPYTLSHGYAYQQTADGSSVVVATDAVTVDYYGVSHYAPGVTMPPNCIDQSVPASSNSNVWTYLTNHPRKNSIWKMMPKKTKIVQSAWCGICNIECNKNDVLEQHKLGKKHKKNLEKLQEVSASGPSAASVASAKPIIGPQENPNKTKSSSGQKVRKNTGEPPEDLEAKRRKVVDEGAAADAVRACGLCNVVCNSEKVFLYHLAGKKHATMVKKYSSATGVTATV